MSVSRRTFQRAVLIEGRQQTVTVTPSLQILLMLQVTNRWPNRRSEAIIDQEVYVRLFLRACMLMGQRIGGWQGRGMRVCLSVFMSLCQFTRLPSSLYLFMCVSIVTTTYSFFLPHPASHPEKYVFVAWLLNVPPKKKKMYLRDGVPPTNHISGTDLLR